MAINSHNEESDEVSSEDEDFRAPPSKRGRGTRGAAARRIQRISRQQISTRSPNKVHQNEFQEEELNDDEDQEQDQELPFLHNSDDEPPADEEEIVQACSRSGQACANVTRGAREVSRSRGLVLLLRPSVLQKEQKKVQMCLLNKQDLIILKNFCSDKNIINIRK